ncbi:MAG: hypothetical protein V4719_13720 [Planctomycetota bacterium]
MDARIKGICLALLALCSVAATDRSRNFVVTAPTFEIAKQVAQQAEIYRHKLAVEWLGKPLPAWKYPCTVKVDVGQIGAGGATTFVFQGNSVGDFKMNIQGPLDRILDSVLPHEINHTIFAEHFRRPLPRWADEGAATFVEDESERRRQMLLAMQVLKTNRRIPLRSLLGIMDYPKDMQDVLHLYAEGYVLVELLIQNGGRGKFLAFIQAAHTNGWDRALHTYYGHRGVNALDGEWNQWVLAGCPAKAAPEGTVLASADPQPVIEETPKVVARSQAPDREPVSVEDLAEPQPLLISATNPSNKRGVGLQAPPPVRKTAPAAEPAMLSQVELGSGTSFNPSRSRAAAPKSGNGYSGRSQPQQLVAELDEEPLVEEEVEPEIEIRPSRPSQPVRAAMPRIPARTLVTPPLRLDSRPQLGQAQPFPRDEA